ncbi:MAG: sigma-54 dependent transcriptional regulator [Treponema sp.]|jgi:two-component system response regulator AtoC|nr:sigma-54 dependent transcriptional regulator [Treponema sp.]
MVRKMRVLIVDDERNIRLSLQKYLSLEHIDAESVETGEGAIEYLSQEPFDAVILDLKLPRMSGQEVLEWIQQQGITTPVIMISAHGQIPDAVQALQSGAKDYLVKPFDPAELIIKLRSLGETAFSPIQEPVRSGEQSPSSRKSALIGATAVMERLSQQIDKLAATDVTVLLTGESGTGKEVAAREIHCRSAQRDEPFVAVNIGGIHEGLIESELFGHEKGAFTGALTRKQGLFELAGRGCLFLDEIGEMPMPLQVKLLRVLQERKIRRLGGLTDIPLLARIVSATNRDLEAMVREGRFREDLYYRINVFRIELPPLRERREDIPLLADHLLTNLATRMGRPKPNLVHGVLDKLRGYSYPGNIRELENILERAIIYGDGRSIRPEDLGFHALKSVESMEKVERIEKREKNERPPLVSAQETTAWGYLEAIEREAIREALARCQGNRTKAAQELGISRKTILNKIKSYGLLGSG